MVTKPVFPERLRNVCYLTYLYTFCLFIYCYLIHFYAQIKFSFLSSCFECPTDPFTVSEPQDQDN